MRDTKQQQVLEKMERSDMKTFSNEQLCKMWVKVAKENGTRRDVVLGIMGEVGIENTPANYSHAYNNVSQRVKNLGVTFPVLTKGKREASTTPKDLTALQAILAGETETPTV